MRGPDESGLNAIEQRFTARARLTATAGHRDRVLAAVRDTLAEPRGAFPRPRPDMDGASAAVLVVIALSALVAVVAPWLMVARVMPVPMEPRIVAQARAAGIDLPVELVAAPIHRAPPAIPRMREPPSARLHDAWNLRNLLTGEL